MRSSILCVLLCALGNASVAQEVPVLHQGDLSGGTILSTDYYTGQALFGYIDGGAELYLEYGFRKLGRQEVRSSNETIVVEIYQMAGANEAYGIFSVQRFKCVPVDSLTPNTCLSKYQVQAVVGNCYVSIVNESGSAVARRVSIDIFRAVQSKMKPLRINVPGVFDSPELAAYRSDLIIACGRLGVQNGFAEWDSLFQNIPRFSLALLPIEIGSEHLSIAHIRFASDGESLDFCRLAGFAEVPVGEAQNHVSNGLAQAIRRLNKEELLFAESTLAFPRRESLFTLISR
ncbi:MAG: hypothetical protein NTZ35_08255 [Ignavibacteriales bacterium]|nr:hypothetical protein [Ignavibacteriales bacterium]